MYMVRNGCAEDAQGNYILDTQVTVITRDKLSNGAFRLYALLASMTLSQLITNTELRTVLQISSSSFQKYREELSKLDLVQWVTGKPLSMIYIGTLQETASKIQNIWEKEDMQIIGE